MIKIGCCTNMIATGVDGTGIEYLDQLATLGFDYIELPLAEMTALSEESFAEIKQQLENSPIHCETCNNFFPKDIRLTGNDVDNSAVDLYVHKALKRAEQLGAQYVVFGSGPAKNVPAEFPLEEGYQQVVALLQRIAPIAESKGITIVIEPLRQSECNLINTFAQGCRLAADVGHPSINVLVDYYHLSQENEPVQNLLDTGEAYLRHVHFARDQGRGYPDSLKEDAGYASFFSALREIGYSQRISLEAYTTDFNREAPGALRFLREQTAGAK